jgi:chromosome partitioning protein
MPNTYCSLGKAKREQSCEGQQGVDLLPATEDLYMIELDLASAIGREARLKKLLKVASLSYDYILIDMPPSLGLMQINGLNAADEKSVTSKQLSVNFYWI